MSCANALWIVCYNQLMFVLLNGIMNSAPSSFTHAGHVHIYPYGPRNTTAHTTSLSSYPSTSSRIASVLDVHSKRAPTCNMSNKPQSSLSSLSESIGPHRL